MLRKKLVIGEQSWQRSTNKALKAETRARNRSLLAAKR